MKGVELPTNTIVVVIICLVILLAVIVLLLGVWNPGKTGITLEAAKSGACQMIVSMGCSPDANTIYIRDFDANKNEKLEDGGDIGAEPWNTGRDCGKLTTSKDNLATLCNCYYNLFNQNDCKKTLCNCNI